MRCPPGRAECTLDRASPETCTGPQHCTVLCSPPKKRVMDLLLKGKGGGATSKGVSPGRVVLMQDDVRPGHGQLRCPRPLPTTACLLGGRSAWRRTGGVEVEDIMCCC